MKYKQSLSLRRRKAEDLYRKFRAILILTNRLDPIERMKIDYTLKSIPTASPKWIDSRIPELSKEVKRLSLVFGVIGSTSDMENYIDFDNDEKYPINFVPKYDMDQFFKNYERILPDYSGFPPHALIGIELEGVPNKNNIVVFILEASLFEDMAALWNATLDVMEQAKAQNNIILHKQETAFKRATAKAAFNLLEGYLNGMALDILKTKRVSLKDKAKLTEWDQDRERPKFLTLRDKLLQYPKIALGVTHPPLDESRCSYMAEVLDLEQSVRHALIHPTPKIDGRPEYGYRELVLFQLTVEEVGHLCDIVIELIFELHKITNGAFGRINNWLHRREPNGRFANNAFR